MLFINPQNEYPRFYGDLQIEHPDWEPGAPIPEGWQLVAYTEPPQVGENETLEELSLPKLTECCLRYGLFVR